MKYQFVEPVRRNAKADLLAAFEAVICSEKSDLNAHLCDLVGTHFFRSKCNCQFHFSGDSAMRPCHG
jgi:hypothetical protein